MISRSFEEIRAKIGDWAVGAPGPKLDAWYEKYGGNFDKNKLIFFDSGGKINLPRMKR